MKKLIRLLTAADAPTYKNLLSQAFGNAPGFTVKSEATDWSKPEEIYATIGVFHDDQLVSCMRVESVLSQNELNFKLSGLFVGREIIFPAMYLTKAGTLPNIKAKGLNSVLRYLSLKIAVSWGVRYVFGTMVEGSPRIFTMQEMGYEFQKSEKNWNGPFVSEKRPLMACLDLKKNGAHAFAYLEKRVLLYLQDAQMDFKIEEIKINLNPGFQWPSIA